MNNEIKINIPTGFQKLNSLPKDPDNSISYAKQTESSNCFIMMFPINKQSSMPYENEKAIIDGIHNALGTNQGLVEVKSGITNNQKKYVYSIVKSKLEPSGMQYILTMHIDAYEYCINIQSFFDEIGMTGSRDTLIMNKMINEGKIALPNMDGWFKDPYDENYKSGIVMNLSEKEEYDAMFPQHPLSETRNLIKYIIENN